MSYRDGLPSGDDNMRITAIDPSLTAIGVATHVPAGNRTHTYHPPAPGPGRLAAIASWAESWARASDLVVIEGYSFGSQGKGRMSMGELGGVLRLVLEQSGTPWAEIPPASLKKLATGRGNASKEAVLVAAIRRLGYLGESHHEADARWLLEAALQHHGLTMATLPKTHLAALDAIRWPSGTKRKRTGAIPDLYGICDDCGNYASVEDLGFCSDGRDTGVLCPQCADAHRVDPDMTVSEMLR